MPLIKDPAGQAYEAAQEAIYTEPSNDLSVYRMLLQQVYHVTVLGQEPPPVLRRTLENILAGGEPAELAPEVLKTLVERRAQQLRRGTWVEGHYRPGKRI